VCRDSHLFSSSFPCIFLIVGCLSLSHILRGRLFCCPSLLLFLMYLVFALRLSSRGGCIPYELACGYLENCFANCPEVGNDGAVQYRRKKWHNFVFQMQTKKKKMWSYRI
jgi:hypothetical protein